MKRLLQHTCTRVSKRKRKRLTPREYDALQQHYRNILTRAERELPPIPVKQNGKRGRVAKSDAHNLWERLKEHENAVLLFARDPNVPFTNNRAERDLRMSKVKQKVSGCFRKAEFAQAYCRICRRSPVASVRPSSPKPTAASRATFRPWPTKATTLSSLFRWPYPVSSTPKPSEQLHPDKNWKFNQSDIHERKYWKQYMPDAHRRNGRRKILRCASRRTSR